MKTASTSRTASIPELARLSGDQSALASIFTPTEAGKKWKGCYTNSA